MEAKARLPPTVNDRGRIFDHASVSEGLAAPADSPSAPTGKETAGKTATSGRTLPSLTTPILSPASKSESP